MWSYKHRPVTSECDSSTAQNVASSGSDTLRHGTTCRLRIVLVIIRIPAVQERSEQFLPFSAELFS